MLTLVAAVLAYERVRESTERLSSCAERSEFRNVMSETSVEKDMAKVGRNDVMRVQR